MSRIADMFRFLYLLLKPREMPSPRDRIAESDISYDCNTRVLTVKNIKPDVWITSVADTNSMESLIDYGHSVILTNDFAVDNLQAGDVIVYNPAGRQAMWGDIIHQIIRIGNDGKWWCYCRGMNNPSRDSTRIRDDMVKWLALGVLW